MPFDSTPVEQPAHVEELLILDGVIELLREPEHWCKGTAATRDGTAFCVLSAVAHVCDNNDLHNGVAHLTICRALNSVVRWSHPHVAKFNDDPYTRHADVMALLTKVRAQFQ